MVSWSNVLFFFCKLPPCQQANRWWLHLYRLLTGEWNADLPASNPLQPQEEGSPTAAASNSDASANCPANQPPAAGKVLKAPDWPSVRGFLPDWLWSGLVSEDASPRTSPDGRDAAGESYEASLGHARGWWQSSVRFYACLVFGRGCFFLQTYVWPVCRCQVLCLFGFWTSLFFFCRRMIRMASKSSVFVCFEDMI